MIIPIRFSIQAIAVFICFLIIGCTTSKPYFEMIWTNIEEQEQSFGANSESIGTHLLRNEINKDMIHIEKLLDWDVSFPFFPERTEYHINKWIFLAEGNYVLVCQVVYNRDSASAKTVRINHDVRITSWGSELMDFTLPNSSIRKLSVDQISIKFLPDVYVSFCRELGGREIDLENGKHMNND